MAATSRSTTCRPARLIALAATASLLAALCLPTLAAPSSGAADLGDFDRYIEQARAQLGNVGVAVAVVRGDQVIYAKGFGDRELGATDPVGPDTLFQIGSTTKAFTTAALGILVDEGKLRWDDRVIDHLPAFRLQDPWLERNLTIRDTVSHRSGIADTAYFVFTPMDEQRTIEQLRYLTPSSAFRDSYHYSNLMYAVAGQVVASVSGMSWHDFVQRRLLQPLQMRRSHSSAYAIWERGQVAATLWGAPPDGRFSRKGARDRDVAMPHLVGRDGKPQMIAWQSYDSAAAAGTIVSSANDMAHWLVMQLNQGRYDGRQLLQPATVKELQAVQNLRYDGEEHPFTDSVEGYALGWRRMRYQGAPYVAHSGGIVGFPAYMALMPEQGLGVVVLANSARISTRLSLHKAITLRAFDQLLGQPQRDWIGEFAAINARTIAEADAREQALRDARPVNAPPSLPLARYAGVYEDRQRHSGPVTVAVCGDRLELRFAGAGAFAGDLEPWQRDTFRLHMHIPYDWEQFPTFHLDPSGQVVAMSAFDGRFERVTEATP